MNTRRRAVRVLVSFVVVLAVVAALMPLAFGGIPRLLARWP